MAPKSNSWAPAKIFPELFYDAYFILILWVLAVARLARANIASSIERKWLLVSDVIILNSQRTPEAAWCDAAMIY